MHAASKSLFGLPRLSDDDEYALYRCYIKQQASIRTRTAKSHPRCLSECALEREKPDGAHAALPAAFLGALAQPVASSDEAWAEDHEPQRRADLQHITMEWDCDPGQHDDNTGAACTVEQANRRRLTGAASNGASCDGAAHARDAEGQLSLSCPSTPITHIAATHGVTSDAVE